MNALDIAELSLIEISRWQREVFMPKQDRVTKRRWRVEVMLRQGNVITAQQIADALGVCTRTVFRDIVALRQDGMRIGSSRGVGYLARRPTKGN